MNPRFSLTTERMLLRMPQPDDVRALQLAIQVSLPELGRWMPQALKGRTQAQTRAYIYTQMALFVQDENLTFAMFSRTVPDQCLGIIELGSRVPQIPSWELSFWLRSDMTGQGLMREAGAALLAHALTDMGARRVFLRTEAVNTGACRVAEALGMTQEGRLVMDAVDVHGQPADTMIYAVTR